MSEEPNSAEAWAQMLLQNWERRAQSPDRDFFVASHPGWDDPETWERLARDHSEAMLYELDRAALARQQVLEIGCGVGRLGAHLGDVFEGYTGVDIAPGMVAQARRTHAGRDDLRFLVGDGLTVPTPARDREYGLVLALAVFIHCPRDVIASLISDAWPLVQPGGSFRMQIRADPNDPTGIISVPSIDEVYETASKIEADVTPAQAELVEGIYYMGDEFGYDELQAFLEKLTDGTVRLYRTDRIHTYAVIDRT